MTDTADNAPDRIWHIFDRRGKIACCPDAHVQPCEAVAGAYVEYRRSDLAPDPLADPRVVRIKRIMQQLVGEYADDAERQAEYAAKNGSYDEADQAQSTANLWHEARAALAAFDKGGKTDG
jgi:hypothetical protein